MGSGQVTAVNFRSGLPCKHALLMRPLLQKRTAAHTLLLARHVCSQFLLVCLKARVRMTGPEGCQ
jgi:hypothetical protein